MKMRLNFLCILALSLLAVSGAWTGGDYVNSIFLYYRSIFGSVSRGDIPTVVVVMGILFSLFLFYFIIRAFISFIRFIMNVNRDKVFVKENLPLLRWTGKGILIYKVTIILIELMNNLMVRTIINGPVAEIHIKRAFFESQYSIFFAIFCLIIAEVFAIGIKLKEDQELTI